MEFRQLQLFVAVAEEPHFGRAAARVGMAQPPSSQQSRRLETELGVELLTRTSRRVALTSAGSRLMEDARELLAKRKDVITAVQRAARGESGTLRISFGAPPSVGRAEATRGEPGARGSGECGSEEGADAASGWGRAAAPDIRAGRALPASGVEAGGGCWRR
ncbi:LysR family transcriptional regulator [Archangium lipolyticum]|uniref:LysR family transcriptional regulator n=1 Tax=Archangium lipolyticum TaxID=2970465 RepID=UPI00214A3E16|nr:LysR family transcriptional regulator [Archangium lipolyticum]